MVTPWHCARLTDGSRECHAWSVRALFVCQKHRMLRRTRPVAEPRLGEARVIQAVAGAAARSEIRLDQARRLALLAGSFQPLLRSPAVAAFVVAGRYLTLRPFAFLPVADGASGDNGDGVR